MKEFWKGVFSDGDAPSFSRCGTGVLVSAAVTWVTYIVFKTTSLPDLGGLSLFVVVLYGANVTASAARAIAGKKE